MENFLMVSEAARVLRKSEQTVRAYERGGKLAALKTSSGRRLFRESDVLKLAKKLNSEQGEELR